MTEEIKSEKKLRGFALLSKEERQARARLGGLEAHRNGTAHEFNSDEARKAAAARWAKVKGPKQ